MQRIALLILCLAAISCDKKVVKSVDVPVEEAFTEEALTEDVLANAGLVCSGSLQLPTGAGLLAEDLQVLSSFGAVTPNAAGKFNISMAEGTNPQFVVAIDSATDNSLLLGYMDPAQGEHVHLSCESTALGLAFLNPLMMGTTTEQRREFISEIRAHPNFSLLVEAIEATFQADPQHTLDYTAHPALYEQAAEISVAVWQDMAAAGKLLAPAETQEDNVCEEDKQLNLWIADIPNNNIVFCNPKAAWYVAEIQGEDDFDALVEIKAKQSAYTLEFKVGIPPFDWGGTPPEPTPYELPSDGVVSFLMNKGYDYHSFPDLNRFMAWDDPYGRASWLNIAQFVIHVLSLLIELTPLPIGPEAPIKFMVGFAHLLHLGDDESVNVLNAMRTVSEPVDRFGILVDVMKDSTVLAKSSAYLKEKGRLRGEGKQLNNKHIAKLGGIFKNNIKPTLNAVTKVSKLSIQVIKEFIKKVGWPLNALNTMLPFFFDVLTAEQEIAAQFEHIEGAMLPVTLRDPPAPLWEEETFELLGDAAMEMVRVEPGTFWMGESDGTPDEVPSHLVTISKAFWLGKHEVTQGQWYAVMGTRPWAGQSNVESGSSYPATYISWEAAQEFIARLNERAGERRYRLPTEAEWEYACRAGTTTRWSFGDELSDLADGANPWGLHDMHEQVAEWVQDWYDPDYYNFSPVVDPQGPLWPISNFFRQRIVRGGSIFNARSYTRSASRRYYAPDTRNARIGFRLVRLEEPEALAKPDELPRWTLELPRDAEMEMVWIKPGAFEMGTSDEPNASPHEVEISTGFWLGTHEVTQAQWEAVMEGTAWAAPWAAFGVASESAYPATYISWEAAQEFIARLNERAGERWYRLPTEAEWEYACRAGTQTRWSFGDDSNHLAYFAWSLRGDATGVKVVGLKRANAWGLRDMHGNVGEWVQDWYDEGYYANSPVMDPQGPSWPPFGSAPRRVIRGGSILDPSGWDTRSASRNASQPGDPNAFTGAYIGFRLVRDERPQELPTRTESLPGGASMGFVRVEPGVFQMGSDNGDPNEKPVHEVEISKGFWLGTYEVTKAQWEAVMEPPSNYRTRWAALSESHPAIGISWNAAQEFIETLNTAAGERRYRLPTEAEWEYACRAGMPTQWSFGDDERRLEHYAWYRENASGVNEVGQKRPNFWGLYDMHGNVQEWVQDRYGEDYYANSPVMDPAGPDTGNARVRRGGIYNNRAESVRSARREGSNPSNEDVSFGFRLAMLDRPEPLQVDGSGVLGEELLALTSTLLVSVLDLFSMALLAFGLDEEVPVDGLGGGTVVLAGNNWTLRDYSPDGSLIINGSLVVDMTLFPAVPISGELTTSGSIESTVVLDLLLDLETAALIGMITIDGENFDMADIIAAAEGREVLPEEEPVDGGGTVGEERTFSLPGGAEMEFVWIEPGVFQMGATESELNEIIDWCVDIGYSRSACVDWHGIEEPLHEVEISTGFYLGKYEITQGQWEAMMGTTPWAGEHYVRSNPSHPAVYISWYDTQAFIGRLNASAGDSLYRLPSEAEWEYACRAGTTTRWSFGDDESQLTDYAWYGANAWAMGERYAHAVGMKLPNAWGLYDMHGNVWEWVQDWGSNSYYNSSPRVDPPGPDIGSRRGSRGGGFFFVAQATRSASRGYDPPDVRQANIGARLVRIR